MGGNSDYSVRYCRYFDMRKCGVLLVVLWLIGARTCWAEVQDQLTKENAELRQRVERLEQELDELSDMIIKRKYFVN